ncbi:class I adenylate-forming enzyme family protein [Microvirga zambiensis]|uniref:class I adenylate-forming enzyme family protein n=1 Tax=Microvirga zambiensis TaxID=1402137 RepID=UPI00191E5466|nr:class I adenylate-forming enzyme family protein [Microvirga zambiensis]
MHISNLLDHVPDDLQPKSALRSGDLVISYQTLHRDVEAVAGRLAAAGVNPGQVVGVYVGQSAAHWCVLLALMRLGAVSVSLTSRFQAEIDAVPDLSAVIHAGGDPPASDRDIRMIAIGEDWLESTCSIPLPAPDEAERHFGRICFTSGTAGKPKAIRLDSGTLKRRLSGTAGRSRLHTQSVLWCGLGPDSAYGFTATLATWMIGGSMCFLRTAEHAYEDLVRCEVDVIIASPAALNTVLQSRPENSRERINGPVIIAGGRLSTRLRDLLLANLCSEVLIAYGASETGGVTLGDARVLDRHPGAVGPIFPDVQVEVVGENGQILPIGMPGRIRIKTTGSVSTYLNDPIASARHFSADWFYPGDIAQISGEGLLTLMGRDAEILNVGGVKLSADDIDEAARSAAGVEDACAFVLPDRQEGARLAIAVAGQLDAVGRLPSHLRSMMPSLPPFSVVPVSAIPRNSMGKVNREEFAQRVDQLLRNPGAAAAEGFAIIPSTPAPP